MKMQFIRKDQKITLKKYQIHRQDQNPLIGNMDQYLREQERPQMDIHLTLIALHTDQKERN